MGSWYYWVLGHYCAWSSGKATLDVSVSYLAARELIIVYGVLRQSLAIGAARL